MLPMKVYESRSHHCPALFCCSWVLTVILAMPRLAAQPLVVAGSPRYDSESGIGFTRSVRVDVNSVGTAVGQSEKHGVGDGMRAVRWDASGTAATELGTLGADNRGYAFAGATDANNGGTAVGWSSKYLAVGTFVGTRAVRWDASGTTATELASLGTDPFGLTFARANAVNNVGAAVGYAYTWGLNGNSDFRAVRWDASGTGATELGNLGTDPINGTTYAVAEAVNSAGAAVGYCRKHAGTIDVGNRAVRWDASGTVATELGNLGTDGLGFTDADAIAVNSAGTAVGYCERLVAGGIYVNRAVRWDASGTAAAELRDPGDSLTPRNKDSQAYAVSDSGTVVGFAHKYIGGIDAGQRAVIWESDGTVIDLNDLGVVANPPDGTWLLTEADAISNNGWVAGVGIFTPMGGAPYERGWVAHIDLAVPEPGTFRLVIVGATACGLATARRAEKEKRKKSQRKGVRPLFPFFVEEKGSATF
jgi:hypothetical protein